MGANWPVGPISHGTAEMAPPTGFTWRRIEDQIKINKVGDKMPNGLLYSEFLLSLLLFFIAVSKPSSSPSTPVDGCLFSMMGGLDKTVLCSVANSFGSSEEACDVLSCDFGVPGDRPNAPQDCTRKVQNRLDDQSRHEI